MKTRTRLVRPPPLCSLRNGTDTEARFGSGSSSSTNASSSRSLGLRGRFFRDLGERVSVVKINNKRKQKKINKWNPWTNPLDWTVSVCLFLHRVNISTESRISNPSSQYAYLGWRIVGVAFLWWSAGETRVSFLLHVVCTAVCSAPRKQQYFPTRYLCADDHGLGDRRQFLRRWRALYLLLPRRSLGRCAHAD